MALARISSEVLTQAKGFLWSFHASMKSVNGALEEGREPRSLPCTEHDALHSQLFSGSFCCLARPRCTPTMSNHAPEMKKATLTIRAADAT